MTSSVYNWLVFGPNKKSNKFELSHLAPVRAVARISKIISSFGHWPCPLSLGVKF